MKEIISAVFIIASIWGGSVVLKSIHDCVRKAALEKASQGLPSLQRMSQALQTKPAKRPDHASH